MAIYESTPPIVTNGLVLALDAANIKSFPDGEPTTNLLTSPINLGSNRSNAVQIGAIFTDFSTGSYNNGPFVRLTRNVNSTPSPTTAWDFEYQNSSPGYPNGTKHTFSFYARSVDGSTSTIKMSNPDVESQFFNLTTQWQRFIGTFTLGAQISGQIYLRINRSNQVFTSGSSYDISNAQIEFKDYATPFVSGSRTLWNDLSGNGYNGTFNTASFTNLNGGAVLFNGLTSSIAVTSTALQDIGGTINTWVYPIAPPLSSGYIISAFGTNSDRFYITQGGSSIATYRGNPMQAVTFINSVTFNQWYNLTSTWVSSSLGSSLSGYLNGVFVGSTPITASGTTSNFHIGGFSNTGGTQAFSGSIALTQIYNRALSSSEVLQNYNALKNRFNLG
jgi:hypothetical protein